MRDRVLYLLRYVICVCAFCIISSLVVATPAAPLQIQIGPNGAADTSSGAGQYKLSGTVVDALTGAPIRRAMVQLMGGQSQAVLTDEGGKFRFENLAQGQSVESTHISRDTQIPPADRPTMVTVGAGYVAAGV